MRSQEGSPGDRRRAAVRGALVPWAIAVAVSIAAVPVIAPPRALAAQGKEYRYETDPVRLGMKSVEQGDLAKAKAYFDEAIENGYRVEEAHRGLGEILLLQGRYAEARVEFTKALSGTKKVPEANAGLGIVALREGNVPEAEGFFTAALEQDDGLWRGKYGLARIAILRGELVRAAELLKAGSKKKGIGEGAHLYHLGMALLLVAQGKLDEAETHAVTAMDLAPADPDVVLAVGDVYEKKGVADIAIGKFEAILADPAVVVNKAQIHHRLGTLYEKKQKYNDAIKNYQAAIGQDSTLADAYKHAGALFQAAKQFKEAAYLYYKYTQLVPDDADGLRRFAEVCIETGNFGNALDAAKRAAAIDSTSAQTRRALARAAAVTRNNELALSSYAEIKKDLLDARDHMNLGTLYMQGQRNDEAREELETAVAGDTTLADAYFGLGYLDLLDKDYLSAEDNLKTAVRLSPGSAAAVLNLGIVQLQLRKYGDATASFKRAAELAPKSAQARVYLGQAYSLQEDLKAAEAAYREALALDAASFGALKGLGGYVLLTTERYAEAEAVLAKATELNPMDSTAWSFLGQACHYQGKDQAARAAYERALAIDPTNKQAQEGKAALLAAGRSGP